MPLVSLAYFNNSSSTFLSPPVSSITSVFTATTRSNAETFSNPARARKRFSESLLSAISCNSNSTLLRIIKSPSMKPLSAIFRIRPSMSAEVSTYILRLPLRVGLYFLDISIVVSAKIHSEIIKINNSIPPIIHYFIKSSPYLSA